MALPAFCCVKINEKLILFWNGEISLQVESTILSKALKEILVKNFSTRRHFFCVFSLILGSFAKQESYASQTHYESTRIGKEPRISRRTFTGFHGKTASQIDKLEYEMEVVLPEKG